MLQMGFSRDEIQEALANNRYDEVMATYLLLDERRQKLTVRLIFLCPSHLSCRDLQTVMIICWQSHPAFSHILKNAHVWLYPLTQLLTHSNIKLKY